MLQYKVLELCVELKGSRANRATADFAIAFQEAIRHGGLLIAWLWEHTMWVGLNVGSLWADTGTTSKLMGSERTWL